MLLSDGKGGGWQWMHNWTMTMMIVIMMVMMIVMMIVMKTVMTKAMLMMILQEVARMAAARRGTGSQNSTINRVRAYCAIDYHIYVRSNLVLRSFKF